MDEGTALLQWNSYSQITKNSFAKLYDDNLFTDVTLVCEDNMQVTAHKVVLSACSDFFRNILKENSQPSLVIYLHDTKGEDLLVLKGFMYLGFAEVKYSRSKSFRELANRFLNKSKEKLKQDTVNRKESKVRAVESNVQEKHPATEVSSEDKTKMITNTNDKIEDTPLVPSLLACSKCNLEFDCMTKLKLHKKKEHELQNIPCSMPSCDRVLRNMVSYKTHIKTVHEADSTQYTCDECSYSCKYRSSLNNHKLKHSGLKGHKSCELCGYTTNRMTSLTLHMERNHKAAEYTCTKCDKKFKTKVSLNFHNRKVHQGIRYYCVLCPFKATRSCNLKIHILRVHENFQISCQLCDYKDVEESRMKLHVARKHGQDTSI